MGGTVRPIPDLSVGNGVFVACHLRSRQWKRDSELMLCIYTVDQFHAWYVLGMATGMTMV